MHGDGNHRSGQARRAPRAPSACARARGALALALSVSIAVLLALSAGADAAVWTDQPSYAPGSTVTISGDDSDGAGYTGGEEVAVAVSMPSQEQAACSAIAGSSGAWSCQIMLSSGVSAIGSYSYTATGGTSGVSQTGTFTDSGCPTALGPHEHEDPNIRASYTVNGGEAKYSLTSSNESSVGGIPGLIEYCVYTSDLPDSAAAVYGNLNGAWVTDSKHEFFAFTRSDGNPDNVPFDGSTQAIGTATWTSGKVAADQTILLHINDAAECKALYGTASETCFATPGKTTSAQGLTATKTATPSFTRTYTWGITKSANTTEIVAIKAATFRYTVSVTHDGGTDSGWQVSGKITVTNPNAAAVTGVEVSDAVNDAHSSCAVSGGSNVTVPASSAVELPYSCTFSAAPGSASETNTATVKWATQELSDGSTLTASSTTGTAAVEWSTVTPTIADGSVSVSDSVAGALGTVSYSDPSPKSFEYERTFSKDPSNACTTHENTATLTTSTTHTKASASRPVTHCKPGQKELITCKAVTFSFGGFPNLPGNTVSEQIKADGVLIYSGKFTFNGPSGSNTVPISLSPGTHEVTAGTIWKTNGTASEGSRRATVTCT